MTNRTTLEKKETYLDILAVFYYVNGGLSAILGLTFLAFLGIGLGAAVEWGGDWQMEPGCALTFALFLVLVLFGGYAALNLVTARALQTRNHYVLNLVTSALNCLNMPLGTLLGIFTLVLLSDAEVRALFRGEAPPAQYGGGQYGGGQYGEGGYGQGYGTAPQTPPAGPDPSVPPTE